MNQTRSTRAAKRFFRKVLGRPHITTPRVINVDKNPTYIGAVRDLKREKLFPEKYKRRPSQYMNNIIEQDHRFIKRKTKLTLGFKNIYAAQKTLAGVELVRMIKKGQLRKTRGEIKAPAEQFYALAT